MEYVKADESHLDTIARLASRLWHSDDFTDILDLKNQLKETMDNQDAAFFLCYEGKAGIGFAQFSQRNDYVEGTRVRPVGYLEGIYVLEQYRNKGIARRLLELGEGWAMARGCSQMASDCELTNESSLRFHLSCGFTEANRIICFVKDIGDPGSPQ